LRGIGDKDVNAAKVSMVETTTDTISFKHPNIETLVLWDLPGSGTINHPKETYYEDKTLYAFDVLLIVTATR